jgi:hypothetical protein
MTWIRRNIRWIMIVSGVLTTTMFKAALVPDAALRSTFGESLSGPPLAEIVVRNWGALIGLIGGMLIYGAFNPPVRPLVLVVAGISKVVFIGLVLTFGQDYLAQVGIAVAVDSVMILLFAWYLVAARTLSARSSPLTAKVSV